MLSGLMRETQREMRLLRLQTDTPAYLEVVSDE